MFKGVGSNSRMLKLNWFGTVSGSLRWLTSGTIDYFISNTVTFTCSTLSLVTFYSIFNALFNIRLYFIMHSRSLLAG